MRFTTYNPDGTIKETKTIDIDIPKYVREYDDQHSFLNITSEEVEVVNSPKNTFRKTLILRRLTDAITHDYTNYRNTYKVDAERHEIHADIFVQEAESNQMIQAGDKIISSIMRIYGNHSRYSYTEMDIDEQTFIERTCTQEEFLIFINKVEHQTINENGSIASSNWINIILYHAFKGASIRKLKYGNIEKEARLYISLQNLINRYYYSLRNMERMAQWMPAELKQQMYVLSAFVQKADLRNLYLFDASRFFIKLINALYLTKEQHRHNIYLMAEVFLEHRNITAPKYIGQNIQFFRNKTCIRPIAKDYEVDLYNYSKTKMFGFIINDDEIYALRNPSVNEDYEDLISFLKSTYEEYVSIFSNKWISNIQTDANIYFNKQKPHHEDWWDFYNHVIEKYRPDGSLCDVSLKPQNGFYFLLCDNVDPDKRLDFNKDIVMGLIDILKEHPCNSQEGLYECMYKINYIKQHIPPRDPIQKSTQKALDYVGWLYTPDCKYINNYFKSGLRNLLQDLLSVKGLNNKITKVAPDGFTGGFNLVLLYQLLGLLHSKNIEIIKKGSQVIDKDINRYAITNGLIKEQPTERKSYIQEFSKPGSEKNTYIEPYMKELMVIIKNFVKDYITQNNV